MANARNTFLLFLAWFLPNAFAGAESWTSPPPDQCPALAVMGDPSRNSFSTATPALLDSLGYRVRVVWDSPASALVVQRLLPVLLVERQHFTREQYESLRTYVRAGGGLVLIGYAANWLDADGNQRRDKTDPEITNESGSGGLAELVGASRVGGTSMIRTLQPVAGDPVSSGVEGTTWGAPDMGQGCNVVALKTTTGTVACRMVQQQFQWPKGVGDVIPGQHDLVVHRDAGSGRVVWIGWTGIISAARKDNATARRLLRNAIAWAARDIDLTTSPTGTALAESQLWQPAVGRFGSALGRKALPEVNNVETMMCHFSGRWHKVFGMRSRGKRECQ